MIDCTFCSIARGDVEAHRVLDDDRCIAFLDHRPLFAGHCLLVPRAHHETLADLPETLVAPLFLQARRLALAVQKALDAEGTFLAINNRVSQSVLHLHVHIVPRRRKDGLRGFFWPRGTYRDDAHMAEVRDAIRTELRTATSPPDLG